MSINEQSPASRPFVASCSIYSPNWAKLTGKRATIYIQIGFWAIVLSVVLMMVGRTFGNSRGSHRSFPNVPGPVIAYGWLALLAVLGFALGALFLWRWRRKYHLDVTPEGLTIDGGRGDFYSFADAQLGLWASTGLALHLRRGRHRFILGGRDCRVGPTTPLSAPPAPLVDAWLSQPEFVAMLSLSGRWRGLAVGEPAPGDPVRCVLFPNPLLIQQMGPFALMKKQRLTQSLSQPQLFIDVDDDTIRVIDADSNALTASASLSQVTATRATYRLDDVAGQYFSTMPAVTLGVPGSQPLTIGCRDFSGLKQRFLWGENVAMINDPPAYAVSGADWMTLTAKLHLAS
ncbi:hypothetical protein [Mycobacterium sp. E3247]|uniref:hypothetical protein n=1 Tax=Mycobacterium sp. E3247 TaxID=1856864 RepID=UPI0007FBFB48|nr:hypothetical protein [Mycobacterium sp. E3247]OBH17537.1 hypothetical protein A9X04_09665 [Mycobacterium sp. E3247]